MLNRLMVFTLLLMPTMSFAHIDGNEHGWHMMNGWSGMAHTGAMIFWLLVLTLLVISLVKCTKSSFRCNKYSNENPLEILKKRYAKGEITKEEMDEMQHNLKSLSD